MSFRKIFDQYSWDEVGERIYSSTEEDVIRALKKSSKLVPEDFVALVSPGASNLLEEMAQQSQALTQKRFGKTIQMYIPMYLSNECQNICTYCGFSLDNKVRRRTLLATEILQEATAIKS